MKFINVWDLLDMPRPENPDKYNLEDDTVEAYICCANCKYGQLPPKGEPMRFKIGTDIRTIKCPECNKKKLYSVSTAPVIHRTLQ